MKQYVTLFSYVSSKEGSYRFAINNYDKRLTKNKRRKIESVLTKHLAVLSIGSFDLGRTRFIYNNINTEVNVSARQGMLRIPHKQITILKEEVDKLQKR